MGKIDCIDVKMSFAAQRYVMLSMNYNPQNETFRKNKTKRSIS